MVSVGLPKEPRHFCRETQAAFSADCAGGAAARRLFTAGRLVHALRTNAKDHATTIETPAS